jgi:hypothetical protein
LLAQTQTLLLYAPLAYVRNTGAALSDVLTGDQTARDAGVDLTGAFDLTPAIAAAARWVNPALRHATAIARASLPKTTSNVRRLH